MPNQLTLEGKAAGMECQVTSNEMSRDMKLRGSCRFLQSINSKLLYFESC